MDEASEHLPDAADWVDPEGRSRLLIKFGGNVTDIGEPERDPRAIAIDIASYLQDHVMDHLNRPWPEIVIDDRTVVLEPSTTGSGDPEWAGGGASVPFGDLALLAGS